MDEAAAARELEGVFGIGPDGHLTEGGRAGIDAILDTSLTPEERARALVELWKVQ